MGFEDEFLYNSLMIFLRLIKSFPYSSASTLAPMEVLPLNSLPRMKAKIDVRQGGKDVTEPSDL